MKFHDEALPLYVCVVPTMALWGNPVLHLELPQRARIVQRAASTALSEGRASGYHAGMHRAQVGRPATMTRMHGGFPMVYTIRDHPMPVAHRNCRQW